MDLKLFIYQKSWAQGSKETYIIKKLFAYFFNFFFFLRRFNVGSIYGRKNALWKKLQLWSGNNG